MKKNILSYTIAILAITGLIIGVIFISNLNNDDLNNEDLSENETSVCDSYDTAALVFDSGDVEKCDCLEDESEVTMCRSNLGDKTVYERAIEESDLELCESIVLDSMKNSCLRLVQSKIDYTEIEQARVDAELENEMETQN